MKSILLPILLSFSGCLGYSAIDNTALGQVKRIHQETPMICPNYIDVDISLGITKNGVGSVSTQDIIAVVTSAKDVELLKLAQEKNILVKITYNEKRLTFCTSDTFITKVELDE